MARRHSSGCAGSTPPVHCSRCALDFVPPQVQLRRANIATDRISDLVFEVARRHSSGCAGSTPPVHCSRCALDFVPPQVSRKRANITTDCISDREFEKACRYLAESIEAVSRSLSRRRRTKLKRRHVGYQDVGTLKDEASCKEKWERLSHQASKLESNQLSEFSDRASPPSPLPQEVPLSFPGVARLEALDARQAERRAIPSVVDQGETSDIGKNQEQPDELHEFLAGIPSLHVRSLQRLPRARTAADRVYKEAGSQSGSEDPWSDLSSSECGDAKLARIRVLRGPGSKRWRLPRFAEVCGDCRAQLLPRSGRWLRFCVCPHRRPTHRAPMPPEDFAQQPQRKKPRQTRLARVRRGECPKAPKRLLRCLHGRRKNSCRVCHGCSHGRLRSRCPVCGPRCPHGRLRRSCRHCGACPHGLLRDSCSTCSGCSHGFARAACMMCNGCPHGRLYHACAECLACPHGRLRRNCPLCIGCPHGRLKEWCTKCNACDHGKVRWTCAECRGCPHGLLERFCRVCRPCPHGCRREHCVDCSGCAHGKLPSNCPQCSGCPHGRVKRFCADCNPCPHGRRKQACKECSVCPHGKIGYACGQCKGCPHGKVRRFCRLCNGCPHGQLLRFCKFCPSATLAKPVPRDDGSGGG
ncbi:unnamed protein product [Polarella glacialis]|uniref:Uncharacterized protein n=1 Tax=Polarella glacialis TaxID=89957 RepID=A0A813HJ28_POLGL|nr:unnamed protein product [Polarella glacialis]